MRTQVFSLMVYFCLQFSFFAQADTIVNRQARLSDLNVILSTYRNYSEEDRKRLLVFPEEINPKTGIPFDESKLKGDLERKRLFVSELVPDHGENHRILGIVKLFLVPESEVNEILGDELCALQSGTRPILAESFDSGLSFIRKDFLKSETRISPSCDAFPLDLSRQTFVYYGGAYTHPDYRGKYLHSELLSEALEIMKPELLENFRLSASRNELVFAYGQVEANVESKGMIYKFANFTQRLFRSSQVITHLAYEACKPNVFFDSSTSTLKFEFPPENRGRGNLVVFHVHK